MMSSTDLIFKLMFILLFDLCFIYQLLFVKCALCNNDKIIVATRKQKRIKSILIIKFLKDYYRISLFHRVFTTSHSICFSHSQEGTLKQN